MNYKRFLAGLSSFVMLIGGVGHTAALAQGQKNSIRSASPSTPNPAAKMLAAMPLIFEKNMGQAVDGISFLSHGDGFTLALKPDGAILSLRKDRTTTAVLRVNLQGANPEAQPAGVDPIRGKTNYLYGKDPSKWLTNVPNFQKVKVGNALPGVDVLYYGSQRNLEYDFDVAPGADPGNLTLLFDGASALKIDSQGDLIAETAAGPVRFKKPDAYQQDAARPGSERTPVEVKYVLEDKGRVSFSVAAYDHQQALVIDPTIIYATFWAGYNVLGDLGTGYVNAGPRILGFGTGPGGAADPSVDKRIHPLTQAPPTTGATYLIYGIDEGNQFGDPSVDGVTASTTFTGCPAAGCINIFVTKFDPSQSGAASLIYTTLISAIAAEDYTNNFSDGLYAESNFAFPTQALSVDSSGDAYFTGGTDNPDYPTTTGAYQTACNSNPLDTKGFCTPAMYASELSPDGTTLLYSTLINAHTAEPLSSTYLLYPTYGLSLAADNAGAIYIGGYASAGFPVSNNKACNGTLESLPYCFSAVAVKLNTTLTGSSSLVYAEEFYTNPPIVATDGNGNLYWASDTCTNPATAASLGVTTLTFNGYQSSYSAYSALAGDGCDTLFKLNSGGVVNYATFFYDPSAVNASVDMQVLGLAADSLGRAYMAGRVEPYAVTHVGLPIVNGFHSTDPETEAAWIATFDTTKTGTSSLVYSSVMEGIANVGFQALAINGCGSAATVTSSNSNVFPLVNPLPGTAEPGAVVGHGYSWEEIVDVFNTYMTGTASLTFSSAFPGGVTFNYVGLNQLGNLAAVGTTGNNDDIPGGENYTGGFPVTSNAYQTKPTRGFSDGSGPNPVFAVIGQAVLPGCLNLAPTTLAFGNEPVNSTSAAQQVVLTNTSQAPLTIDSIAPSAGFGESDDCNGSLTVGAYCTINATFEPTVAGAQTGTLTFTDSDGGSPQVINLSGTGTEPPVTLSPMSLNFDNVVVNTTSAIEPVTLTNNQSVALMITSLALTGSGYALDPSTTCPNPGTMAAGGNCTISVTFKPLGPGTASGALSVFDNAAGSPQTVALSGTGLVFTSGPHPPVVLPPPPGPVPGQPPRPPMVPQPGPVGGTPTEPVVRPPGPIVLPPAPPAPPDPGQPAPPPPVPPTGPLSGTGKGYAVRAPGLTVLPLWPPAYPVPLQFEGWAAKEGGTRQ